MNRALLALACLATTLTALAGQAKIVFLAGPPQPRAGRP